MSNTNGLTQTYANYVDLQTDVKPWLQIPFTNLASDARLQVVVDALCQWAQNYLGRPIAPTTYSRRFNGWSGWNGSFINLPYYPILEVTSVTEWWGISGPHVLLEQTPENQVDGYTVDYQRGMLTRVFPGLVQKPWFPGNRNIEITWTAGFDPLPGDIRLATLEHIATWWKNLQEQSGNRPGGASSAYEPEIVTSGLWQGFPDRLALLLDDYVQVGIG